MPGGADARAEKTQRAEAVGHRHEHEVSERESDKNIGDQVVTKLTNGHFGWLVNWGHLPREEHHRRRPFHPFRQMRHVERLEGCRLEG